MLKLLERLRGSDLHTRDRCVVSETIVESITMPKKQTIQRARRDRREGKSASTQAGEFVREEIETIRKGEHGARSTKQAIAIGLSKARRAGVKLPVPEKGRVPKETRRKAMQDLKKAERGGSAKPSRKRSQATLKALKRESRAAASKEALSRQARAAARKRSPAQRSASARKAARTRSGS
jgi:Family of unknown function (DUF6496)